MRAETITYRVNREPAQPLLVGLAIAIAVHLIMLPSFTQWLTGSSSARLATSDLDPILPTPDQPKPGRDSPRVSSVAWIPHDDFRQLIAPQSQTEQPALQDQTDADPNAAAIPLDPTPPTPQEAIQANQTPRHVVEPPPQPQSPLEVTDLIIGGKTSVLTHRNLLADMPQQAEHPQPTREDQVQSETDTQTESPTQNHTTKPHTRSANPTAAPRSDRESSPATLRLNADSVQPGGVLVGNGIEIKTARLKPGIAATGFALPNNPVALLIFDQHNGSVIKAKLLNSTGYDDWDGPIIASLYKWRATGPRLGELGRPFEFRVKLLLVRD